MKNAAFFDDTPCGTYKNCCFEGRYRLHHQGYKNRLACLGLEAYSDSNRNEYQGKKNVSEDKRAVGA
jgi:hypothetical protein